MLNKNDELKYLIIYFEEKYKKNILRKYFINWKKIISGAINKTNIKKYENENNNINLIYRNQETNNIINYNEKEHFSNEEKIKQNQFTKEKDLIEMKKYIIDYDEDLINKNKIKENINKNIIIEEGKQNFENNLKFNEENKNPKNDIKNTPNEIDIRTKTDDENEKMEKYRKKFKELEEEYRIKYLLSSKNDINDNDAENLINIKNSINKAVNDTKENIYKIDEYKSNKINSNYYKNHFDKENENISVVIFDSLEKENLNMKGDSLILNNNDENKVNKKYFINNDLKIEKVNTKVINNFNIKLENLSQKGNKTNQDKYLVSNVNEFSFAPISSSHHNDKKDIIFNKRSNHNIKENKISEDIIGLKDLNESNKSDNNINIDSKLNNIIFDERLINEEMIQKFLENKRNEGIFEDYKRKNSNSNKIINSYNYKNKYLGYTLGGIKRKRQAKSSNNILKSENTLDININKSDEEIINKSNITSLKKDNSNFLTINKINNMLEEMFDEDKSKKIKINISETDNNSIIMNQKIEKMHKANNMKNNIKKIKRNHILQTNDYLNFNKPQHKINKDKLFQKNQEKQKFKVNIKGNDKRYILNSNKNTGNNTSKNSSNNIPKRNSSNIKIPLSNMTFNERLDFFKNKKGLDIEKIKTTLMNKESNIYTFCPRTNKNFENKPNEKRPKSYNKIITYENSKDNTKTKINYEYLNGLYMDYKKRNLKLKKLREENDKEDGISFNPFLYKNNKWVKSEK